MGYLARETDYISIKKKIFILTETNQVRRTTTLLCFMFIIYTVAWEVRDQRPTNQTGNLQ